MSTGRRALIALFIALEGLAALGMLVVSVHGPSGLGIAACVYFVLTVVLTWLAARQLASTLAFVGIGCAMLAAVPGIVALLAKVEDIAYKRRIAATRVGDVHDEIILSASGHPIGVRLAYTVTVPKRGYFGIVPTLYGRDARSERLNLNAARWTIDGSSNETPFEPGKTHAMVVELYPPILFFFRRDERCVATTLVPPLPDSVARAPLRVMISETTYGNVYNGGTEQLTRGAYDLGELYRGVLAEGLKPCA
jgi:hypothetical protein